MGEDASCDPQNSVPALRHQAGYSVPSAVSSLEPLMGKDRKYTAGPWLPPLSLTVETSH